MLARDDWISTWWAQENWFWSKPVLDFWLQALSFSTFGLHFQAGEMLASVKSGLVPQARMGGAPAVFLLILPAVYLAYRAAAQRFGERAGIFRRARAVDGAALYVIGRQSMTDMPYVAPLTRRVRLRVARLGCRPAGP